jgi:hypothetical protein
MNKVCVLRFSSPRSFFFYFPFSLRLFYLLTLSPKHLLTTFLERRSIALLHQRRVDVKQTEEGDTVPQKVL